MKLEEFRKTLMLRNHAELFGKLWEAAKNRDSCDRHCELMAKTRGCTCGHKDLALAIAALEQAET